MRKTLLTLLTFICTLSISRAQINAALFRFPDVSATQIVFTYANDLWVVSKEGGLATHLSSPSGVESFPKFSPEVRRLPIPPIMTAAIPSMRSRQPAASLPDSPGMVHPSG